MEKYLDLAALDSLFWKEAKGTYTKFSLINSFEIFNRTLSSRVFFLCISPAISTLKDIDKWLTKQAIEITHFVKFYNI